MKRCICNFIFIFLLVVSKLHDQCQPVLSNRGIHLESNSRFLWQILDLISITIDQYAPSVMLFIPHVTLQIKNIVLDTVSFFKMHSMRASSVITTRTNAWIFLEQIKFV